MAKTKALDQAPDKAAPSTQVDLESNAPASVLARVSETREPAPPPAGEASAGQAAKLLEFPGGGVGGAQRARMASGLQRTVGNARMGQMFEEPSALETASESIAPTEAMERLSQVPDSEAVTTPASGASEVLARGMTNSLGPARSASSGHPAGGSSSKTMPLSEAVSSGEVGPEASMAATTGPMVGLGATATPPPVGNGGGNSGGAPGSGDGGGVAGAAAASEGVIHSLVTSTPTAFVSRMASAGAELTQSAQSEEAAAHEQGPELRALLPGSAEVPAAREFQPPSSDVALDSGIVGPEATPPELDATESEEQAGGSPYNEDVATDPGPPPTVELSGSSDPARASAQAADAQAKIAEAHVGWTDAVDKGPGAEQVQPIELDESAQLPASAIEPIPEATLPESAHEYTAQVVGEDVRQQADQILQPQFEEHLAGANEQLQSAVEHRDVERATAIEGAQSSIAEANAEAGHEQDQQIASARADIEQQQSEVRAEEQLEVEKAGNRSVAERERVAQEIAERQQQDDAEIARRYDDARQQAEAEKQRAEQEADSKRQEAEEQKKDKSLWSRAVSAVGDFVSKIASVVTAIFDVLAKVVTAILDKVKAAATRIIDAAIQFATRALDTLSRVLQTLVSTLVGSVFPGLAKRLNAFIDQAVASAKAAVTAIGEKLKSTVNAIVDGLGKAIRKALQVFKTAITTGLQFAAAVVTGDFSGAFRALLEGALSVAGISPEAFYGFVGKPMETILGIVKAPGKFLLTLLTAVKTGFGQFASNMLKHLKAGFFAWIVGPIGEMGLSLPKSWDLKGIFSLVLGVLGLNREGVRKAVVAVLGERAGGRVFDFVLKYFDALMEDGVGGLWEQLKDDLSGLWTMVVDGIKGWLITKIVQQAVIKIASLFNPVSAIVQVVLTAWNLFNFLRENIARIWGVVKAVVGGIAQIVKGAFAPVANIIEQQLAKLIPVAISLLANLLGLGGLTKVVRKKIESAQEFVFELLKKLIAKVKGLFKRGKKPAVKKRAEKGMGGKDSDALKMPFSMAGEAHQLTLDPGPSAAIVMASDRPERLHQKIDRAIKKLGKQQPKPAERLAALRGLRDTAKKLEKAAAKPDADESKITSGTERLVGGIVGYAKKYDAKDIGDVLANEFPAPEVGPYGKMTALGKKEEKLADGKGREAHHVPPVELAVTLSGALQKAGKELIAENPQAAQPLIGTAMKLSRAAAQHGKTLPSILVHQNTHRLRGGAGPRIHGSEIKEELAARLDAEGVPLHRRLTTTKKKLTVKPGEKAFQRQLVSVARERDKRLKRVVTAVKRHGPAITRDVYQGAFVQSVEAVKIGVRESIVDGPANERESALTTLEATASAEWEKKMLTGLFEDFDEN